MRMIRDAVLQHRGWLAWACALALAVRVLVPAGYMPVQVGGLPAITICDGTGGQMNAMADMPGMAGKHGSHDKSSNVGCPFGVAAMAWLGSIESIALIAPLALPFTISHIIAQPGPRLRTARLRPPAQGPPKV